MRAATRRLIEELDPSLTVASGRWSPSVRTSAGPDLAAINAYTCKIQQQPAIGLSTTVYTTGPHQIRRTPVSPLFTRLSRLGNRLHSSAVRLAVPTL
jgi:hypothetical protein